MLVLDWADALADYGVCLCPAAAWFRRKTNNGKPLTCAGWQVWAARYQVEPSRVYLLEQVYSKEELAAAGLAVGPAADREAQLIAAGRKGKR